MHFISLFLFRNFAMPSMLNFFSFPILGVVSQYLYWRSLSIIFWFHIFAKILCQSILFVQNQNLPHFNNLILSDSTIPDEQHFYEHFLFLSIFFCKNANCICLYVFWFKFKLHWFVFQMLKCCSSIFLKLTQWVVRIIEDILWRFNIADECVKLS